MMPQDDIRKMPGQAGGDSEFLIYQTESGQTRLEVRLENETVWLTQKQMAELFQKDVRTINEHIQDLFEEGELSPKSVIRKFRITAADGKGYETHHYNLDAILSVGYRVKSQRGTQFRQWATQRLREHIVKGFTLDDDRFKRSGGSRYFDELLARIRDIRSSEKVFWRKVLDIYSTSVDYDPNNDQSKQFFAVVQNKMHWAAHGHTAAEIIRDRAAAEKPHMGMTTWAGDKPAKSDSEVAKNYLDQKELEALNRIVNFYLEFAELQALNRRAMYMKEWIGKLDEFLKLGERDILTHAGRVSHEDAIAKAHAEYEKFHVKELEKPSPIEKHFIEAIQQVKQLEPKKRKGTRPPTSLLKLKHKGKRSVGLKGKKGRRGHDDAR
jgi:hypothetical protein